MFSTAAAREARKARFGLKPVLHSGITKTSATKASVVTLSKGHIWIPKELQSSVVPKLVTIPEPVPESTPVSDDVVFNVSGLDDDGLEDDKLDDLLEDDIRQVICSNIDYDLIHDMHREYHECERRYVAMVSQGKTLNALRCLDRSIELRTEVSNAYGDACPGHAHFLNRLIIERNRLRNHIKRGRRKFVPRPNIGTR